MSRERICLEPVVCQRLLLRLVVVFVLQRIFKLELCLFLSFYLLVAFLAFFGLFVFFFDSVVFCCVLCSRTLLFISSLLRALGGRVAERFRDSLIITSDAN